MNRALYDKDVLLWAEEQASLLRAGDVAGLDLENLAEEIESVGVSERKELRSRLAVLLHHLLKWRFQPEHQCRSWSSTIGSQRDDIEDAYQTSPSLRGRTADMLASAYRRGRRDALRETGLDHLPVDCPFTLEQILDPDWLP